jgi:hypothetical protein
MGLINFSGESGDRAIGSSGHLNCQDRRNCQKIQIEKLSARHDVAKDHFLRSLAILFLAIAWSAFIRGNPR